MERLEQRTLLSATITIDDITAEAASHTVTVAYNDSQGIDTTTIDASDVTVTGPQPVTVTFVNFVGSGTDVTATYSLAGPGGGWDAADNGTYGVTVDAGDVKDAAGNDLDAGDTATMEVAVAAAPGDTTAPSANISVNNVSTAGGSTHTVSITYADESGINAGSIDVGDITVTRNGGGAGLTVSGVELSGSGNSRTAVYTLAAPGSSFDAADNGDYTVMLAAGAVQDASLNANGNAAGLATFTVAVAGTPADSTAPTAEIAVNDVTTGGGSTHTVTVTYRDDTALDASTVGTTDLDVSRNGGGAIQVTGFDAQASGDGKTITTVYMLAAPGGSFDAADNGTYTVSVRPNEVRDAAGNAAAPASDTFAVNIAGQPPGGADTTGPTASITAADVTTAGGATHTISVVYTDDTAVDVATIGTNDLSVTGPGSVGALTVTAFSQAVSGDGKSVTTTYTLAAPGGSFDTADSGTYALSLNAGAVSDAAGNAATGAAADFDVRIVGAPGAGTGPTATVTAPDITAPGGTTQSVTVVYADDGRIRANMIGVDDISVTSAAGGTPLTVTGVTTSIAAGGGQVTAVYTVAAPGGTWDTADNGSYAVTVNAGAVSDTQGNASAAASGAFAVNATVIDLAPPAVAGVAAADITSAGVAAHVVNVTYTDDVGIELASVGVDDITVAGPAGAALTVSVINIAAGADLKSVAVAYTVQAPSGGTFTPAENGAYAVTVNAGAVLDTSGKPVAAATGAFNVAVPQPPPVDPQFGGGSPVVTNFAGEAAATGGADESLLVAGRAGDNAVLERRNPDGSLDTRFGGTGQVVSTTDDAYFAVIGQGEKVVVAGTTAGDFVLVRYNADGSLDTSFGTGGRVVVDFGQPNDVAYALTVAADGRLVAAGQSNGDFAVARFSADGVLDASFGDGGKRTIDIGGAGGNDLAGAVVVDGSGRVLLAGSSGDGVAVVRLTSTGAPDTAFSGDGELIVPGLSATADPANPELAIALAVQADGKVLVGNHTAGGDFGIARLDISGNLDPTFGTAGIATADFAGSDDADAILLQPSGEIVVAGTSLAGSTGSTTVAAFDQAGNLIDAFATGGRLTLDSGLNETPRELRIGDLLLRAFGTRLADGRIVLGVSTRTSQTSQSALRRVNAPGVRSTPQGIQIGTFANTGTGVVDRLVYTDGDGTRITFMVRNGTGVAFLGADDRINLVITASAANGGAVVSVRGRGGNGRMAFGDVRVDGTLRSMSVRNADLAGTFCATGAIGKVMLGDVSGGSICAGGDIGSVLLTSLTNAKVMAGANLGADGEFGGSAANADTFGTGAIGKFRVSGAIVASTVAAGLDPVDATFFDNDDRVTGGAASVIRSISAASADDATRFIAGAFGKARLGTKVTPATDPRFRVL